MQPEIRVAIIGAGIVGLINLIGIESPGLTAAPAIARRVGGLVRETCG